MEYNLKDKVKKGIHVDDLMQAVESKAYIQPKDSNRVERKVIDYNEVVALIDKLDAKENMVKISSLCNDDLLVVGLSENAMTKATFVKAYSPDAMRQVKVYVAKSFNVQFSVHEMIAKYAEEMYDGWAEAVEEELKVSSLNLVRTESVIQNIFNKHPVYYKGEEVDVTK